MPPHASPPGRPNLGIDEMTLMGNNLVSAAWRRWFGGRSSGSGNSTRRVRRALAPPRPELLEARALLSQVAPQVQRQGRDRAGNSLKKATNLGNLSIGTSLRFGDQ